MWSGTIKSKRVPTVLTQVTRQSVETVGPRPEQTITDHRREEAVPSLSCKSLSLVLKVNLPPRPVSRADLERKWAVTSSEPAS